MAVSADSPGPSHSAGACQVRRRTPVRDGTPVRDEPGPYRATRAPRTTSTAPNPNCTGHGGGRLAALGERLTDNVGERDGRT
jgi:hypothetical protein